MKITTDHKKTFQPVNVTITFESEEELLAVKHLIGGCSRGVIKRAFDVASLNLKGLPDEELAWRFACDLTVELYKITGK